MCSSSGTPSARSPKFFSRSTFPASQGRIAHSSSTTTYSHLSAAIRAYADGFLAIVARHTPTGGGLAEWFDKASSTPASAVDRGRVTRRWDRVRWRLGCKENGSRLLSRQAIGVKDDHLRYILMYIDGPQSVAVSTSVGVDLGITPSGYLCNT